MQRFIFSFLLSILVEWCRFHLQSETVRCSCLWFGVQVLHLGLGDDPISLLCTRDLVPGPRHLGQGTWCQAPGARYMLPEHMLAKREHLPASQRDPTTTTRHRRHYSLADLCRCVQVQQQERDCCRTARVSSKDWQSCSVAGGGVRAQSRSS